MILISFPRLGLIRGYDPNSGEAARKQLATDLVPSIVVRPDVVGTRIHLDARNLVGSLTMEDNYEYPLVYGIAGTGGIGKSTLARLVFENSNIKNHFSLKMWVSPSQDFNEIDIMRTVVESFDKTDERGQSMSYLQDKFKKMVNGKKVFLVLEDVWEVENVWNRLFKSLLMSADVKCSCKVLVTTRDKEVAVLMKAVYFLQMEPLPLEDGWLLLRKAVAAASELQEAVDDAWGLKEVGIEFVKKCNGLPLAIKAIGGVLSAESRTREAWTSVLKNSSWDVKGLPAEIHRALYVSYHYLPSHVKQCFLYCSLNPKDVLFLNVVTLVQWIEEGFIKDDNSESWYAVGESYLRLLVRRNLLTYDPKSYDESIFVMHDLLRSLCRFFTQHESLAANEEELSSTKSGAAKMKLRRLSFVGGFGKKPSEVLPKSLQKHSFLRSLLVFDQSVSRIDGDLFNHLRRLKVLFLDGIRITELPASVGSLTHLIYLNLARTLISELPETIGNLRNLRVLIVSRCLYLSKLPRGIMNLCRLRILSTFDSATSHLPPRLGGLAQLRILEFSLPLESDAGESSSLEDLGSLMQLRELALQNLERVLDVSKVRSAALKGKQLESLQLTCSTSETGAEEVNSRLEEVYEELCPPSQVKVVSIIRYSGRKLPSWLSPSPSNIPLANLKFIRLAYCSNCRKFPAFGILPNLEALGFEGNSSVESIGPEFYSDFGDGCSTEEHLAAFFPKLRLFYIRNMENWEEWRSPGTGIPTMPCLEILHIGFCPKLRSLPEDLLSHAKNLKKLTIEKSGKVQIEMEHNIPFLEILIVH